MNPGRFNIRMTVLARVDRTDTSGGAYVEWAPVGQIWAARQTFSQRIADLAKLQVTAGEQTFMTRYVSFLTTACRVEIDGKQYRCTAATEEASTLRRELLRFTLKEGETE